MAGKSKSRVASVAAKQPALARNAEPSLERTAPTRESVQEMLRQIKARDVELSAALTRLRERVG